MSGPVLSLRRTFRDADSVERTICEAVEGELEVVPAPGGGLGLRLHTADGQLVELAGEGLIGLSVRATPGDEERPAETEPGARGLDPTTESDESPPRTWSYSYDGSISPTPGGGDHFRLRRQGPMARPAGASRRGWSGGVNQAGTTVVPGDSRRGEENS